MLVLTGTTGHLGSRVLHYLLSHKLISPSSLIISSSNPAKVPSIAKEHGRGATALFLVSFPSPSIERWEHHRDAIEAAKTAGVETVIYTSLMFGGRSGMDSVAGVQQAHIRTIHYLRDSGMKYVILREGIYAQSWWLYAGFQPQKGFETSRTDATDIDFVVPNNGPIAWVSWEELAEGTAKILTRYDKYIGRTLALTGSETLTLAEIGKLVERETGRTVNVKIVGREEAARYHKEKKSVPEANFWIIDSWSEWHDGISRGETAVVDPLLEQLLQRRPRRMEEMARGLFVKVSDESS